MEKVSDLVARWEKIQETNERSKLMKNVLEWCSGGSKEKGYVKQVHLLNCHSTFKSRKGSKNWRKRKSGQWGVSTHSGGTSL